MPQWAKLTLSIAGALLAMALSTGVAMSFGADTRHDEKLVEHGERISVVETQQTGNKERLDRIDSKVDKVLDLLQATSRRPRRSVPDDE